jgi:hypothetical protein
MRISKFAGALSLTGVLSLGIMAPAISAPITPLSASARPAAQASQAIQVRFGGFRGGFGGWRGGWRGGGWRGGGWRAAGWRGGGWGWRRGGWGVGLGALAAGAVIGSALAAPAYYGTPYYNSYDYAYGSPYGYSPVVVGPAWGWGGNPYWRRPWGPWRNAYGFAVGW